MHAYLGGTTGERITDLILENKTSQARLAKALHISEATMSRYISGASEIPGSTLMAIAAHFGVTTDFLLGATDIPFRTNYDLDRLGLSKEAAEKMLAGELDMQVLNTLLANEDFAILTHQIAAYVKDTNNECLAVMNKVMEIAGGVVQKHAKTHPLDKVNAIRAYREIRAHMVDPKLPDTAAMESSWARILSYLREGAEDRARKSTKLTSEIMEGIVEVLEARKGTFEPHSVTLRDISGAIVNVIGGSDFPEEDKAQIEKTLCEQLEGFAKMASNNQNHPGKR